MEHLPYCLFDEGCAVGYALKMSCYFSWSGLIPLHYYWVICFMVIGFFAEA